MTTKAAAGDVIVNKYRLERELGAGGMGSVWLATQLMVDRPVAVKLLHPAFIDQEDLQARFEVEARAIGKLNHPHVITLYDFGFSDELEAFYTVIEYIDGVSLDKKLNQRLPLREVVTIVRQVALALDHAHHHGILHRDLKPENVMLARLTDGSQIAKVLDFGIARIVKGTYDRESPESQRITKAGEVFGTPAYMSPEQARSIRRLNPSSDLYSLGIMFYELVEGRLPFFASSAFDLLMLHVTKPVPPIKRADVPPEILSIVYRLLEKEPEKRFQSGRELAKALERLIPMLPEQDDVEYDDMSDQFDTLVNSPPIPTLQAQFAAALGEEESNAEAARFALPVPPTAEIRADTLMLGGPWRDHDTIPRAVPLNVRIGIAVTVAVFLVFIAALLFAFGGAPRPAADGEETAKSRNIQMIYQSNTTQAAPTPELANSKPPKDTAPEPERPPEEPEVPPDDPQPEAATKEPDDAKKKPLRDPAPDKSHKPLASDDKPRVTTTKEPEAPVRIRPPNGS